jgi:hypothetical protein
MVLRIFTGERESDDILTREYFCQLFYLEICKIDLLSTLSQILQYPDRPEIDWQNRILRTLLCHREPRLKRTIQPMMRIPNPWREPAKSGSYDSQQDQYIVIESTIKYNNKQFAAKSTIPAASKVQYFPPGVPEDPEYSSTPT